MPPKRYNFRARKTPVVWVDDDTLKTKKEEEDQDDSDYIPEDEDEPEYESEEDEDEDESEDESEDETEDEEETLKLPKGAKVSVKLHIHQFAGGKGKGRVDIEEQSDDESEEEQEEDFIAHLMDKYVRPEKGMSPASRRGRNRKGREEPEEPALALNEEEEDYFEDLSKSKKRKLNEKMKGLAKLVSDGEVPYKFRVLELPISDMLKASVIRKIDILNEMDVMVEKFINLRPGLMDSFAFRLEK
jgi:hypothetical protein